MVEEKKRVPMAHGETGEEFIESIPFQVNFVFNRGKFWFCNRIGIWNFILLNPDSNNRG